MDVAGDLETQVARLADIDAIRQTKYRYMRGVDMKDWELLRSTLTDDVVAEYAGLQRLDGREAVLDFMAASLTTGVLTVHHLHQGEIEVEGDAASGIWALADQVIVESADFMLTGAAFYTDSYRRDTDGVWRIAATRYERLFEATESLSEPRNFTLTANRWRTDPAD